MRERGREGVKNREGGKGCNFVLSVSSAGYFAQENSNGGGRSVQEPSSTQK